MSAKAVLPMESYRLAQYAVHVPCYVCEGGNAFDAELCRHCFAPMALVNQAGRQKTRPQLIATVGSSNAGKTVYLGTLMDMLSRQNNSLHLSSRGAFSISLQQRTMAALSRCEFPDKTPGEPDRWNWVYGQLRRPSRRQVSELIMPDMAGEAILEETDHPNTYPVVQAMLRKSSGVLLLVDAVRVEEGGNDQDFFAMKLLSYLAEILDSSKDETSRKRKRKTTLVPPVALVFTKSDQCDVCFDNPVLYAQKHTPGLWQQCKEHFPNHQFFATGVAGACAARLVLGNARQTIPLRVEPRGIIDPFLWLIEQTNP